MQNFKVEVSKDGKKYTFVIKSNSELELKEKLHKEGYSILTISEIGNIEVSGQSFYFEIIDNNGEEKKGNIKSNDILKAYIKLKDELGYKVKYIYDKIDYSELEKINLINIIEKQYIIYKGNNINKNEIKKENENETKKDQKQENFYAKKELEETYKLIEFILKKLKNIIDLKIDKELTRDELEKLTSVYNNIIKIKTSSNISKLKEIGELALKKIGEIELRVLENKKTKELSLVLNETNKLLKKIGSKKTFIERDKDLIYLSKKFINKLKKFFDNNFKKEIKEKKELDKKTYYYQKNLLLLNRYKKLRKKLKKEFYLNLNKYLFSSEENKKYVELFKIKTNLVNQNIELLNLKISEENFSYTRVVNTYEKYLRLLNDIFYIIKKPIFYFLFLYSLFFIFFLNLNNFLNLKYNINFITIKYLIFLILIYLFLNFSKSLKTIIFNFAIFSFIFIFFMVNF
ncbi:MAG: hypothetical protein PHR68_00020 [Candidatus Gracilibacteria bacterium]|nr:hypothetical protein [Candidatus Gracilibacteria bacterium]